MEAPKPPSFSAYDFLGYIVPGLAMMLLADLSYQHHLVKSGLTYSSICARYGGFTWPSLIPLVLLAYFVGHLVSFISSASIEKHAVWTHGQPLNFIIYGHKSLYFDTGSSTSPKASKVLRFMMAIFLFPIALFEIPLGRWLGLSGNYIKQSDDLIQQAFQRSMVKVFKAIGIDVAQMQDRRPWEFGLDKLAIHCALERAPAHVYTLRNYVVLYGFLRSMALVLVIAFWGFWSHALFYLSTWVAAVTFVFTSLFVFICYAAFIKFWFRYYTEAVMAVIACYAAPHSKDKS
jgi:hypothetical protein